MAALNNNRWRDIDGGWRNGMDSIVWVLVLFLGHFITVWSGCISLVSPYFFVF